MITDINYTNIPLDGNEGDYNRAVNQLSGYTEIQKAINQFYLSNIKINPRQLHYILCSESNDSQLDVLLGLLHD